MKKNFMHKNVGGVATTPPLGSPRVNKHAK